MLSRFNRSGFHLSLFTLTEQQKKHTMYGSGIGLLLGLANLTSSHLSNAAKILYLFGLPLLGGVAGYNINFNRIPDKENHSISLAGLDKKEVLAALYKSAKITDQAQFSPDFEVMKEIDTLFINHETVVMLNGKTIGIDLSKDDFNPELYNKHNGHNAAEEVLKPLMEKTQSMSMKSSRK